MGVTVGACIRVTLIIKLPRSLRLPSLTRTSWAARVKWRADCPHCDMNPEQEVSFMATYKVALVPGDGVGPEVMAEAGKVLDALAASDGSVSFQYTHFPWGSNYYRETGRMMPEDGLEQLKPHDAILFGAVGDPDIPDHITLHGLILPIRRAFDQGVCLRPSYLYEGVASPLEGVNPGEIDMVVFRENTEGEYAPIGGFLYHGMPERSGGPVQCLYTKGHRKDNQGGL